MSSPFQRAFSSKSPFKQNHPDSKKIPKELITVPTAALEGIGGIKGRASTIGAIEAAGGIGGEQAGGTSADEMKATPAQPGDMYYNRQVYDASFMRPEKDKPNMKDLPLNSPERWEEYENRGWAHDETSDMGPRRESSSPLEHTGHGDPDPEHPHFVDDSEKMKNEYGQTQTDVLNKKNTAYNDYQNQVNTVLTDEGYVDSEGKLALPTDFPQDILDNINTSTSELEGAYNKSFDSIYNVNKANSIKKQEGYNKLKKKIEGLKINY